MYFNTFLTGSQVMRDVALFMAYSLCFRSNNKKHI